MKTAWFTIFYPQIILHQSFADAVSFARKSSTLDDKLKNEGQGVYRIGFVKIHKVKITKEELARLENNLPTTT